MRWKSAVFGQKDQLFVFIRDTGFICEVFVTGIAYSL
jgi:hypothetical protein